MKIVGLIPARMKSSRFPGKPLAIIDGLPMVVHVLKRAKMCDKLDDVYVLTDNEEINEVVKMHGGKALMTSEKHKTGTDRMCEALNYIDADIYVDIQGDEPLLRPEHIYKAIEPLLKDDTLQISCLAIESKQLNEVNEVKLVKDLDDNIMYFSRADIPSTLRVEHDTILKQYCIIPFRKDLLQKFGTWGQTPLEKLEFVELLRVLEHGYKIKCVVVDSVSRSVDTPEDFLFVEKMMKNDDLRDKY